MTPAARSTSVLFSFAFALLVAGCGSPEPVATAGSQRAPSPEETMATDLPTPHGPAVFECGGAFESPSGGSLRVTGRFPATASVGEQRVDGSVDVTANGAGVTGVVTPRADAFLVRDGRLVTLPVPQDAVGKVLDLADGKLERMPATASLVPCSGGSLPPGSYDVYVRVVLNHDDGSSAESFGGPWGLEVS